MNEIKKRVRGFAVVTGTRITCFRAWESEQWGFCFVSEALSPCSPCHKRPRVQRLSFFPLAFTLWPFSARSNCLSKAQLGLIAAKKEKPRFSISVFRKFPFPLYSSFFLLLLLLHALNVSQRLFPIYCTVRRAEDRFSLSPIHFSMETFSLPFFQLVSQACSGKCFHSRLNSHLARHGLSSSIAKKVFKAQEIIPLLPDGHVQRHDLLSAALIPKGGGRLVEKRDFGNNDQHLIST